MDVEKSTGVVPLETLIIATSGAYDPLGDNVKLDGATLMSGASAQTVNCTVTCAGIRSGSLREVIVRCPV
jgi:hypothetical protein